MIGPLGRAGLIAVVAAKGGLRQAAAIYKISHHLSILLAVALALAFRADYAMHRRCRRSPGAGAMKEPRGSSLAEQQVARVSARRRRRYPSPRADRALGRGLAAVRGLPPHPEGLGQGRAKDRRPSLNTRTLTDDGGVRARAVRLREHHGSREGLCPAARSRRLADGSHRRERARPSFVDARRPRTVAAGTFVVARHSDVHGQPGVVARPRIVLTPRPGWPRPSPERRRATRPRRRRTPSSRRLWQGR